MKVNKIILCRRCGRGKHGSEDEVSVGATHACIVNRNIRSLSIHPWSSGSTQADERWYLVIPLGMLRVLQSFLGISWLVLSCDTEGPAVMFVDSRHPTVHLLAKAT
jgi:hypothetical protein